MFFRKSATTATDHDAEAIARIKQCPLWSHVEFVFVGDRDIRARLARIATALFRASEVERVLCDFILRVEDHDGCLAVDWKWPGPPVEWINLFNAAWLAEGVRTTPTPRNPDWSNT